MNINVFTRTNINVLTQKQVERRKEIITKLFDL